MNVFLLRMPRLLLSLLACLFLPSTFLLSQEHSVARQWNEALLQSIREDFARPPVQARNLFHTSMAMYDAWSVYDGQAQTYLLGKTVNGYTCPFKGVPPVADVEAARREAISYAVCRVMSTRFFVSPKAMGATLRFRALMQKQGYDFRNRSMDYENGSPAALGNYIAECILQMGQRDGSNEQNNHAIKDYKPVNSPLIVVNAGDPTLQYPNRWQPLKLPVAIDQNGNPMPAVQVFQSPEWGKVRPFALDDADLKIYQRNQVDYWVYHDPGPFPLLDTLKNTPDSEEYKWNFALVSAWSAHLDPNDGVMWDISPKSMGNVQKYPENLAELHQFYDFESGKDAGIGRDTNPYTHQPYAAQMVPRGDYTRVLAQFWADGPKSETPPGHWFAILHHVSDHPALIKKFNGKGPLLNDLEWDVKTYFALGGAVHDAAIAAWGIKGWYDGVRPISALRYMAGRGQSSDKKLPRYDPGGIPLKPGLIELVKANDPLVGPKKENLHKIKVKAWRGYGAVKDTTNDVAGVGWILADNWTAYQLKTFVTPPFGGYISGHSTYSRAAAEMLTLLTGDAFFPGGMGEFKVKANSNFLRLEKGPSVDVHLQWATYRDASDQTSLSRIWGGIHPPFDDIPGRMIGAKVGIGAFELARTYFYVDKDKDGHFSYEDCDDNNPAVFEGKDCDK